MSEWSPKRLDEVGTLQRGRSRHRPRYAHHLYGGPYPFVQTGEIREARKYITSWEQTYSQAGLEQSRLWPKGTLCITIAANIAELAILGIDACFPDSVLGFICDPDKGDLDFVFYTLTHFQRDLKHIGEGSVQDNINLGTFQDIHFPIPSLKEQRAIASVLSSIDDKIDLLHRQNKTLEAMAETLFRQWFVEEAEEDDSQTGTLADVAIHVQAPIPSHKIAATANYVGLEHIDRRSIALCKYGVGAQVTSNKYAFIANDILFGRLRPYFHKVVFAPIEGICSTDILVIRPKSPALFAYCLFAFFQDDVVEYANLCSGGTRMPRVDWNSLSQFEIRIPSPGRIEAFNRIANAALRKIAFNLKSLSTLENLRDALLPKLMSGEVRVRL